MSVGRTRTVGTISPVSPAIGNALGLIPTVRAAMSVVPGNGHVLTGMTGPAMANPPDRRVSTVTTDRVMTDLVTTDHVMGIGPMIPEGKMPLVFHGARAGGIGLKSQHLSG